MIATETKGLTGMVGKLFWHLHHDVICEPATEPIRSRIEYIKTEKPKHELALRLKLLRPVRGKLPEEVVKACVACATASAACATASAACDPAAFGLWDTACSAHDPSLAAFSRACAAHVTAILACNRAVEAHLPEIEALHEEECGQHGCPWDGKTIFPEPPA